LEIKNLHVNAGEKGDPQGARPRGLEGRDPRPHGPERIRQVDARERDHGPPGPRGHRGTICFKGEDITEAEPDERARMGLFMAFQYPVAVPGVTVTKYLRTVMNAHREAKGEDPSA
jgi:Fe-S cluster assembly ATP-binding protein